MSALGRVPMQQIQHIGFIIDIDDQSNNTIFEITSNEFSEIQPTYSEQLYIQDSISLDHCTFINQNQWTEQFEMYIDLSAFYQYNHLFSWRHLDNSQILIADNTFRNMSLTSSLFFIEGSLNQKNQYFVMLRNEFTLIHVYMNNIIFEIRRQFSTLNENGDILDGNDFTDDQLKNYIEYGGGILIQENNFTDIVGCHFVYASISQIAVQDLSGLYSGWIFDNDQLNYDMVRIGSSIAANNFFRHRLNSLLESDKSKVSITIPYSLENITLNKQLSYFNGNSYLDVSMGAAQFTKSNLYRGSLHMFFNVMAVDFRHENYTNAMAFTPDHLNYVLSQITNQLSISNIKEQFPYTNAIKNTWIDYSSNWWTNWLSTTLIYGKEMTRLRILDKNIFDSVGLIDLLDKSFQDYYDDTYLSFGLIIKLVDFRGKVQIGGPEDTSMEANQYGDEKIIITNIQGILNEQTVRKFPSWNYTNWPYSQDQFQDYAYATLGSPVFNLFNRQNQFTEIRIQNVLINNFDAIANYQGYPTSAILGLNKEQNSYENIDDIVIKDFELSNATYINAAAFIVLNGHNFTLDGLKFSNIGTYYAFQDKQKWGLSYLLQDYNQEYLFYIQMSNLFDYTNNKPIINTKLFVNNCTVNNMHSSPWGTFIFELEMVEYNRDQDRNNIEPQVNITNCQFSQIYSSFLTPTSMILLPSWSNKFDVQFINCTFKQIMYATNGITIQLHGKSKFKNCTFEEIYNEDVSLQYFDSDPDKQVIYEDCVIKYKPKDRDMVRNNLVNPQNTLWDYPLMHFKNGVNITLRRCEITNYYSEQSPSGLFWLENNVTLLLDDVSMTNASAFAGALIQSVGNNRMTIKNCKIQYFNVKEGIIYAKDRSQVIIQSSQFLYNFGVTSVIFKILGFSNIQVSNSEFSYNQALEQNSIGSIFNANSAILFQNVIFKKNRAISADENSGKVGLSISLCYQSVTFEKCQFVDNLAATQTPNILLNRAQNVIFKDCLFTNSPQQNSYSYYGNFIHSTTSSNIEILNSTMSYGQSYIGGAIYALTYSQIIIHGSQFLNNQALKSGGVIYAEGINEINITDSQFQRNFAKSQEGDSLYLLNSFSDGFIQNSKFISYSPSNFLNAKSFKELKIEQCLFEIVSSKLTQNKENLDQSKSYPASLDITNIPSIVINKTIFNNLQNHGSYGGALSIQQTQNKNDQDSVKIIDSQFLNCTGYNGGAINFNDVGGIVISSCIFQGNHAYDTGGAIFFFCQNYGYDFQKCKMKIENSKFIENSADVQGGAIKWNVYEPALISVQFMKNKATIYGDNIASIPQRLIRVSHNDNQTTQNLRILGGAEPQNITSELQMIDRVPSGGEIDLKFALVDRNNQIVRTNNESKLIISVQHQGSNGQQDQSITIESNNQIICSSGEFEAKRMIFVSWPNTTQKILIATDGIDYSIPGNDITNDLLKGTISIDKSFTLDLKFRECIEGEELLSSGKCRECPVDTYLLTKQASPMECKQCPVDTSVCQGGSKIYPKPGFWRKSIYSDNFIPCPNREACLGQNYPENNPFGACQEGYSGILCGSCQIGYSKVQQSTTCLKCGPSEDTVLRLVGLLFLGIFLIVILVYTSLVNADSKKNFLPVYTRILMNHIQLLVLTSQFELEWPQELKKFFSIFGSITSVSTQIIEIDCLIDYREATNFGEIENIEYNDAQQLRGAITDQLKWGMKRVYFIKLLVVSLLPFFAIFAAYLAWILIYGVKSLKVDSIKEQRPLKIKSFPEKNDQPMLNDSTKVVNWPNQNHKINSTPKNNDDVNNQEHKSAPSYFNLIANKMKKSSTQPIQKITSKHLTNNFNKIHTKGISDKQSHSNMQDLESKASYPQQQSEQCPQSEEKLEVIRTNLKLESQINGLSETTSNKYYPSKTAMNSRVVQTIVIMLFMIHPSIASYMLNSFNCDEIDGEKRLQQDIDVICFKGTHQAILYCVVLPSIALWGFGIPTLGVAIIYKNRNQLSNPTVKSRFGFIYNGYKLPEGQYWEMIIMYRKIILIFIQVFLVQQGKLVQAMSTLVFIMICLVLNIIKHPFTNLYLNMLETMSLVCSAISVYCGLYYISDSELQSEFNLPLNQEGKNFLFSMIVVCHYIFAASWLYHFIKEVKTTVRQKSPKLYLSVFLCCRRKVLEHELEVDKLNEQNAPFIQILKNTADYLQKNIDSYQKGKIPAKENVLMDIIAQYSSYIQNFERDNQIYSRMNKIVEDQEDQMGKQIDEHVRESRYKKIIEAERQQRELKKKSKSTMNLNFLNKQSTRKQLKSIKHRKRQFKTTLQLETTKLPEQFSFNAEWNNQSDRGQKEMASSKEDHLKDIEETEEDKIETPIERKNITKLGKSLFYHADIQNNFEQLFDVTSNYSSDSKEQQSVFKNHRGSKGGFSYHNNFLQSKQRSLKKHHLQDQQNLKENELEENIFLQSFKQEQPFAIEPQEVQTPSQEFIKGVKITLKAQRNQQLKKRRISSNKVIFEHFHKGAISQKRKYDQQKQSSAYNDMFHESENAVIEIKDDDNCQIDSNNSDEVKSNKRSVLNEESHHNLQEWLE